jgi:hypothetical protein
MFLYRLRYLRRFKIKLIDQKRVARLRKLYLKVSEKMALSYMDRLLDSIFTDRYYLAMQLQLLYKKDPKLYESLLRHFIFKSGSAQGHGKLSSSYGPLQWIGFLKNEGLEAKFEINPLCFLHQPIQLQIVLHSKKPNCDIRLQGISYSCPEQKQAGQQVYLLNLHPFYSIEPIRFSLQINSPCLVEIIYTNKKKQAELLLSEKFSF